MITIRMSKRGFTDFLEDQAARRALLYFQNSAIDVSRTQEWVEDNDYVCELYLELSDAFGQCLDDPEDESISFRDAVERGVQTALKLYQFPLVKQRLQDIVKMVLGDETTVELEEVRALLKEVGC